MIETQVSIHDNFSVEFKTGFRTDNKKEAVNQFRINTWIFLPNSIDINRSTYSKNQFYRDVKKNIRLITPIYSLEDILKTGRGPLPRFQKAIDQLLLDPSSERASENYTYQVKMLLCIVKSALRREVSIIKVISDEKEIEQVVEHFIENIKSIAIQYREKRRDIEAVEATDKQKEYFMFGDDFLSNITEQYTFQVMQALKGKRVFERLKPKLDSLLEYEIGYRKSRDYLLLEEGNKEQNSLVISQRNILKKFVESDLFLQTTKKKDGAFVEQFYYSIAAGIAMIFATVISFFATQRYGNFTTDLFIVLVVSYMMKDRIKEIARYYFSSVLSKRYFDTKTKLGIRNQEIGWLKESFDFVEEKKVPDEIMSLRNRTPLVEAENEIYNEQVILYRKWLSLSREEIEKYKEYHLSGINDITRFSLINYIQKMDNPSIPINIFDKENGYKTIAGTKVYLLYYILQCQSDTDTHYKKYRVLFNRDGIISVSELD